MNCIQNNNEYYFSGKILCLVTGASRGFGRAIAKLSVAKDGILKYANEGSQILLLSRNKNDLEKTESIMAESGSDVSRFSINAVSVDLADECKFQKDFTNLLSSITSSFDKILLFNNAGSVGDISRDILDYQWEIFEYKRYFSLNVVSPIFMINSIIKRFSDSKVTLVQTSSLCAVESMPYMSLYCTGKSSMDMYLKCVAVDHKNVRTLNYAPGPLDTDMGKEMKEKNYSEDTRKFFAEMFEKGTIINPNVSAAKLMKILQNMSFKDGDHIDFYDV